MAQPSERLDAAAAMAESPSESLPDVRRGLAATASEELSGLWRGRPLDLPHLRQGLAG